MSRIFNLQHSKKEELIQEVLKLDKEVEYQKEQYALAKKEQDFRAKDFDEQLKALRKIIIATIREESIKMFGICKPFIEFLDNIERNGDFIFLLKMGNIMAKNKERLKEESKTDIKNICDSFRTFIHNFNGIIYGHIPEQCLLEFIDNLERGERNEN